MATHVIYRGDKFLKSLLAANGTGNQSQVTQTYKMFVAVSGDPTMEQMVKLARRSYELEEVNAPKELIAARAKLFMGFAIDPSPQAQQPTQVPEDYGYMRAIDATLAVYDQMQADKVIQYIAKVQQSVNQAVVKEHRLSAEDRLETFLGQTWVQEAMKEARSHERTMLTLKELVKKLREGVIAKAREEVDPTATFYGGDLILMWTDADRAHQARSDAVPYIEMFPAEFKFSRADCGDEVIHGITTREGDTYKTVLKQGDEVTIGYPSNKAKNLATNSVIAAIKALVSKHGGDPATVSYNVKKSLWKFAVMDAEGTEGNG